MFGLWLFKPQAKINEMLIAQKMYDSLSRALPNTIFTT